MKTIIYPARFKRSNAGDILINILLIRELSKYARVYVDGPCEDVMHYLTRNNPFAERIVPRISASWKQKLNNGLERFFTASLVFDPPGHYFDTGAEWKGFLKQWKYLANAAYHRVFGIRFIRIGATIGPYTRLNWFLARLSSFVYGTIGTREQQNFEELHARGFRNLSYTPDIAFLLPASSFQIQKTNAAAEAREYIAISLRGAITGSRTREYYFAALASALKNILPAGRKYMLSCQVEDDLPLMLRVFEQLKASGFDVQLVPGILPLDEALAHFTAADAVVTNRMHVALPALLNGTPSFALTDVHQHSKLANLYIENGLDNLLLNINDPDLKAIDVNEEVAAAIEQFAENARQNNELLRLTIQRLTLGE